jgi:soluble lytic murein transglycosylase-like protein
LSEDFILAARHGAAALGSMATLTLLVGLTMVTMGGMRFGTPSVATFSMPQSLSRLFTAPDAPSVYDAEAGMSPKALLDRWSPYIAEASARFGVPQSWIRAVIRRESGGRTVMEDDLPLTSFAGAQGLMQLMPDTYREARKAFGLGHDAYNAHDNVMAGAAYLSWLHRRYGFPGMFAAYNDGPGNYEQYLQGARALPQETVAYLAAITAHLKETRGRRISAARTRRRGA